MDRNREARRAGMVASSNGISRRRHRTNSLRDSPDEDVAVEFSESVRLRERVKKDRDRDRERERDRDRERERERSSRSKRRRGDDSSQESVNDDEDEEDEDTTAHVHHQLHHSSNAGGGGGVRLLPPNPSAAAAAAAAATSVTNHHHHSSSTNSHHQHHQQLQHRKTFPPSAGKPFRAAPVWKSGNEMMDVPVPRKARSVHPKRSHDWISSGSGGSCGVGDQIHRQASTSPVRQGPVSTSTPSPAPPLSPSSSNASGRRKIKANGSKQRPPPKSSSKSTSSNNPEELEIEIAEVLYGLMTQSQAPLKKEIASNDTREVNNRSCADTKSRVSSPVSGSPSPAILPSVPNSSSAAPFSAVAPKRKRPRQVSENQGSASVRSSPSSASAKAEMDQTMKAEVSSSPNFEKTPVQNGGGSLLYGLGSSINSQSDPTAEPMKVESEIKPPATEQAPESGDLAGKEEEVVVSSPKKESPPSASASAEDSKAMADSVTTKPSTVSEVEEGQREEKKIQIDLMAPPPPLLRSSPEREGSATMDIKTIASESLPERAAVKHNEEDEKMEEKTVEEEKKMKAVEEAEAPPQKRTESSSSKGKDNIGVQLDLEKLQRGDNNSKLHQHHHPLLKSNNEEHPEKANQSSSFPLPPMSLAGWPGAAAAGAAAAAAGLPPMGYMAPLQGVVTMDGSSVPTPPLQPTFSQPRPKRCATHCYIARNIHLYQQFTKMNPFWLPTAAAAAASSAASLFVSKAACNLNVVPTPADLHGNIGGRGVNSGPDNKGGHGGVAIFPGLAAGGGKDKGSQPPTLPDHPAQRKQQQILLQQALPPPIAPNNLLPGHTFIFPLNQQQQQAAAATSAARPGPAKSPANAASNASNSAATGTATTGGAPAAISFSYPNMPPNETPYLAILQNNAYFPIAAVGPPLNYRATHPPSLPMFNGSFCPSQMIHHPSQLHHHHHQQQQQQPQQPTPSSQSQQQMQQNTSISSGSSSSHKLLQNHQQKQRSQGGGGGGVINGSSGSGNLHNFPASNSKTHPPHQPQQLPHGRHIENELGSEDNPPSTAESQGSRVPVNMYSNQNCVMPIHPSNFNLMTPPTAGVLCATSVSGNQSEKKQQQQQGIKPGTESMQPQSFSMSFTSINGASAPGIDISSSMAQANAAIFQNFTEASRQNLHIAAAVAAAAQPKKNYRDESRGGSGDPTTSADDERKGGSAGKGPATVGQSITFSRSDVADASGSKLAANGIDSSRSISLASASGWTARAAAIPTSMGSNAQLQAQLQHKQQQQMAQLQMQQQHQLAAVVARSKAPPTSNGIVYSEHSNPPTSVGMKFPNTISAFPQNLVQTSSNGSPVHSPQWKGSGKTSSSSQVASTTPSSLKSISHQHQQQQQQQQQMRIQPNHTQISFVAANQKSSTTTTSQGQHPSNSNQSQSSSMVIGSPTTTSSISKGASGSPRTTSASMNNKMDHQTPLVVQQGKASVSNPNQKSSSPASGRNVPSILGNNPHISTSSSVSKTQVQQHLAKGIQQSQLFFSSPYAQAQPSSHSVSSSSSSAPATSGYYIQTRRPEQQQPSGSTMAPTTSSTAGMLTLCPVTLGGGNTSDPAKAIAAAAAAAASNVRGGGGLPSQSILHTAQFAAAASSGSSQHQIFPAGFSYVQPPVPTVVQVKPPPEQKQPAA
ncbi:protein TIME FOR COFFEE isoform X3 [Ipomoea triloba]|uniref:protein TIME FOR COFFEE isoform X3 n=1 Tax=Ipomoea triloba TaxID=35885 RepID=UPI00125DE1E5|nr:protein TIME FOR COFFEE isoform X3 [Ipomoea triloba]